MFKIIRKHYLVFILAILAGVLTFIPQFINISLTDNFDGIYPVNGSDDVYYFGRTHEMQDGHINLANPYLFEHKNSIPVQFWLPDYLLIKPLSIFGLQVQEIFLINDLMLPMILVLLTYLIVFRLTNSKKISLLSVLGLNLGFFIDEFNRSPSPQLNFIFFLLFFLFFVNYIKTRHKKWLIISALALGFLFHVYTYYWTFLVVALGIYFFARLVLRLKVAYKDWFLFFCIVFVVASPYFYQMYQAAQLEGFKDTIDRLGMLYTHYPSGFSVLLMVMLTLLLSILAFYKNYLSKKDSKLIFLLSSVLGAGVVVNHHIVTGKNLEFSSHYLMPSVFVFCFFLAYFISIFKHKRQYSKILFSLFVIIISFSIYNTALAVHKQSIPEAREIEWQRYSKVLSWLDKNTERDSVVFAGDSLTDLIPGYTHNNVFFSRLANLHFMTNKEVWERFSLNHYWDNTSEDFLYEYERSIWGTTFINRYGHSFTQNRVRRLLGWNSINVSRLPEENMKEFGEYMSEIKKKDLKIELSKYRLDYLVWDRKKDPHWNLDVLDNLVKVEELGDFIMYRFSF